MSANLICYDQDVCIPSGGSSGSGQPRPPQQSPGLTPPGRTPTPPGQPRSGSRGSGSSASGSSSGSKGSGGSGSGSQGGNGNSPIEIDDLIDGLDDPNFWMIQEMKRREAEMLAAMERAARSKKKAYSLLFANNDNVDEDTKESNKILGSNSQQDLYNSKRLGKTSIANEAGQTQPCCANSDFLRFISFWVPIETPRNCRICNENEMTVAGAFNGNDTGDTPQQIPGSDFFIKTVFIDPPCGGILIINYLTVDTPDVDIEYSNGIWQSWPVHEGIEGTCGVDDVCFWTTAAGDLSHRVSIVSVVIYADEILVTGWECLPG